jgi:hypothetical protein
MAAEYGITCLMEMCQFLNLITDSVIVANKASVKLPLAQFVVKPVNCFAAHFAIHIRQAGDAVFCGHLRYNVGSWLCFTLH